MRCAECTRHIIKCSMLALAGEQRRHNKIKHLNCAVVVRLLFIGWADVCTTFVAIVTMFHTNKFIILCESFRCDFHLSLHYQLCALCGQSFLRTNESFATLFTFYRFALKRNDFFRSIWIPFVTKPYFVDAEMQSLCIIYFGRDHLPFECVQIDWIKRSILSEKAKATRINQI